MIFILVLTSGFLITLAVTPIAAQIARRTGAVDQPAPRRVHASSIPRLGGLSIFVAFLAAVVVSLLYPRNDPNESTRLVGLIAGATVMFAMGVVDDHRELGPLPQLAAQIIAAIIAIATGVLILEIPNPLGGVLIFEPWFAVLFTLFWLVGMMNTINWLDGIDGLAAGVVAIVGVVLFVHTFLLNQYSIALLALGLVGPVLGFLPFSFDPGKIFMGSAGAGVIGFALGVLSIIGGAKVATALLVLSIPILDVAWQIISRVRAGRSPFSADRGHLHHRLLDSGLSQRAIVLLYYVLTALFGALALLLPSGLYKLIALIIIGIGAMLVLIKIGARTRI